MKLKPKAENSKNKEDLLAWNKILYTPESCIYYMRGDCYLKCLYGKFSGDGLACRGICKAFIPMTRENTSPSKYLYDLETQAKMY